MSREALIVFARVPVAGRVKTRLVPPLTPQAAADLYRSFVLDAASSFERLGVPVRWYVDTAGDEEAGKDLGAAWRPLLPEGSACTVHPQVGSDLGVRMQGAFAQTFAAGFDRVVITGTDLPTLPVEFIQAAFRELSVGNRVVLGPALDGGYYLLGMSHIHGAVFRDVAWSTSRVLEQTLDRISEAGAEPVLLPEWYDVDTPDDLARMAAAISSDPSGLQATRAALGRSGWESGSVIPGSDRQNYG